MDFVSETIQEYRARADERRAEGADGPAHFYDKVAKELEERLTSWLDTELDMVDAIEYSGYTRQALNAMKRRGCKLTRRSLPKKAAPARPQLVTSDGPRRSLAEKITDQRRSA